MTYRIFCTKCPASMEGERKIKTCPSCESPVMSVLLDPKIYGWVKEREEELQNLTPYDIIAWFLQEND